MKRFENIFRTLLLLIAASATASQASAQLSHTGTELSPTTTGLSPTTTEVSPASTVTILGTPADQIEVGILTCSPHDEIYSLYGHTALHWHDLRTDSHWVFNYGIFDQKKPHFVWRFMMGQTDYHLECTSNLEAFCDYYRHWGSSVDEQVLDLTPTEKQRLHRALADNLLDPVYRYNFFYDNCATRPRDMVERCLEGTVDYAPAQGDNPSFRQLVHQMNAGHPWAAFGNDLLLGLRADMATTQRERQFLPHLLSEDLDHAIVDRHGERRALVLRHVAHVAAQPRAVKKEFPLSPRACTFILLLVSIGVLLVEHLKRRTLVWWDALLMLSTGAAGCILTLMLFSEHPATSTNLQVLVLNPLSLLFLRPVVLRRPTRWFRLSLWCVGLFLVGAIWQDYAEGMEIVALCLLLRYWRHRHGK